MSTFFKVAFILFSLQSCSPSYMEMNTAIDNHLFEYVDSLNHSVRLRKNADTVNCVSDFISFNSLFPNYRNRQNILKKASQRIFKIECDSAFICYFIETGSVHSTFGYQASFTCQFFEEYYYKRTFFINKEGQREINENRPKIDYSDTYLIFNSKNLWYNSEDWHCIQQFVSQINGNDQELPNELPCKNDTKGFQTVYVSILYFNSAKKIESVISLILYEKTN